MPALGQAAREIGLDLRRGEGLFLLVSLTFSHHLLALGQTLSLFHSSGVLLAPITRNSGQSMALKSNLDSISLCHS